MLLVVLDELLNLVLELLLSHLPRKVLIEVRPSRTENGPAARSPWLTLRTTSMGCAIRLLMGCSCVGFLVKTVSSCPRCIPGRAPEVVAVRVVGAVLLILAVVNLLLAVVGGYVAVAVVPGSYWLLDYSSAVAGGTGGWPRDIVLGHGLLMVAVVLDGLVLAGVHRVASCT